MTRGAGPAPAVIWALLMGLTLFSVLVAETLSSATIVMILIFGIGAAKAELVALHYMEVRAIPTTWQTLYRVWIWAIALMLIGGHLLG